MKLLEDAKSFIGNVVCVGVKNNDLLLALNKNKKASIFTIDLNAKRKLFSSRKKTKIKDGKKVNIKKLRKKSHGVQVRKLLQILQ